MTTSRPPDTLRRQELALIKREDAMADAGDYLCCGVRIDGFGPDAAVRVLLESRYGEARSAHLCNSFTLALAVRDQGYRRLLNSGDINLADGHYVAMVGRWHGQADLTARVYGPSLMLATMDKGREVGLRHYLYGTTPTTIARLASTLMDQYPGLDIVGLEAPPFRQLTADEEDELVERIEAAKPDIVWVGVGTPRQDHFVARHAQRFGCTLVPVGAAFDFNSGTKRAAPRIIQRMGLEWLFRFAQEPRRLWRRYLIGIPVFIFGVLTDLGRRRAETDTPAPCLPFVAGQRVFVDPPVQQPATGTDDLTAIRPCEWT
jgi:N-acetylglucosaminyldiphosphoundecaprenol N-acetyl-beta-D-mannosaminyltransferase